MKNKGCLSSAPPRPPQGPPPPVAVAECCMCGDYGLPSELFHCKVCLSRYQHKYCSDLYLKSEAYHTCNWCLREASSSSKNNTTSSSHSCSSNNNNNINGGNTIKINRTSFSSNLHKPVKKQRFPQHLKARVRRYKLLEDVSS
ncbi:Zinc finger RING/FYVE/PHD-type protein [Dioscorea alata]|uniref:Zinc finger RING/FYVE/PHD-type protein n=1 Tax=Dioscorea alata TaxID=55571 RepID=A0ACB7VYF3_DIOAL|nr:Zinc finger RING/FYVE/PHD-type protein [Dioscorea alata]